MTSLHHKDGLAVYLTFDYRNQGVHTVFEQEETAKLEPVQLLEQRHLEWLLKVFHYNTLSSGASPLR